MLSIIWKRLRQFVDFVLSMILVAYVIAVPCLLVARYVLGDRYTLLALVNTFTVLLFLPLPIVLILALLLRHRWLILGALALAFIAIMWFGPTFLPKAAPKSSSTTLSILDYNVWQRNPRIGDVEAWIRQRNADVVLLQDTPDKIAIDAWPQLEDMYPYQVQESTHEGNLILSRLPFLTTENIPLIDSHRALQRVTIDLNGQTIAIYNVHLSNPFDSKLLASIGHANLLTLAATYDDNERDIDIAGVNTVIKDETLPFIMGGDFNTSDQSAIYKDLAAHMIDSFRERGTGLGTSWPVGGDAGWPKLVVPVIRIDYLWHSAQWSALNIEQGPRLGSDHLGLVAKLALVPLP